MVKESAKQYLRRFDVNEKLIASIDNGIIILDDELKIYHFNKWLEIHTSLKESNLLDKYMSDIFQNINCKTLQRKIKTALRMGTPTFYTASTSKYLIPIKINHINIIDFEHMRQDVSVIPFDIEKRLVALIITDQTNMTNTHNLLQANIQKVVELNNELIKERQTIDERVILIKIDTKHIITDASHAYLELLKYKKRDLLKENIFDFDGFNISRELQKEIVEHIDKKKVFKFEKITLDSEGEKIWLSNTLVPEYDKNAKHIGFIIFGENITSSKLIQEHQEKLLANSRTAAMGEMISMIAHQWRQPLSVINTIIATLKIKKDLDMLSDEVIDTSYQKIEVTVRYLSDTIDDFRNFFKQNKELKTTSIQTVFEKSTHFLYDEMEINAIEYSHEIADIQIITYQNELVQSIINILKNSIDAFKEKIIDKQKISVKAYEINSYVTIMIEDNAGGIKEAILNKVFEPYFSTKSKNGTGLGLYVCKTIIEEHLKGKITIKSMGGKTTTFIELPKNLKPNKEEK